MYKSRKQSDASAKKILIKMVLTSDHLTAATSKTVSVSISKNGAAFGAAGGSVAELSGGFYYYTPNSTDLNTLGELVISASATACDNYEDKYVVVPYDVYDAIDVNITKLLGTAWLTPAVAGTPDVNAKLAGGTAWNSGAITKDTFAANTGLSPFSTGTATAGSSTTITLQTALGSDNLSRGATIHLIGGTGAGQSQRIAGYVNSTKVVTVDHAWVVNPDNTTQYVVSRGDVPAVDASGRATISPTGLDTILAPDGTTTLPVALFRMAPYAFGTTSAAGGTTEVFTALGITMTSYNDGVNRTSVVFS